MTKIGLKLWSINTDNYLKEAQRLFDQGVYDYIELYVVPNTIDTLSKWQQLKIPFIIHNAHFAHNFNLSDRNKHASNLDICKQSQLFADKLKAAIIIFHGGTDGSYHETIYQLKSFKEPRALIENKPFVVLPQFSSSKFCRGATFEELYEIIQETGYGFCLDFGHAVCSANYQHKNIYEFIEKLNTLNPKMYHLSDVVDLSAIYDSHPHLGSGLLNLKWIKDHVIQNQKMLSIETQKDSKNNLDDFVCDCNYWKKL